MNEWGRSSFDSCNGQQAYRAVYVRGGRRQKFVRMARPAGERPTGLFENAWSWFKRWPVLAVLTMFVAVSSDQVANATRHQPREIHSHGHAFRQQASLAQTEWSNYLAAGLRCRSSIDGSNPDIVRQVKARIPGASGFSHIVTTFWHRKDSDYELTMMFMDRTARGNGVVREARGTVDPETCRGRVVSIT